MGRRGSRTGGRMVRHRCRRLEAKMIIDVAACAAALRVVDVWKSGNPSGVVTVPSKYHRQPQGVTYDRFVRHVTAGSNSLSWLAGPNTDACIPYLIPTAASDQWA